ncbi:MAG: CoA ester lyase [Rhodospirillaceae bacterium]|jgi:citrate lyase subunit beta / citryl-CoA lyase|nr:CoA ester lyase [Rhodospirillaceae bacterium]
MTLNLDRANRPRRSALYMPGANERALEKGKSLPADVLIMDVEDGVAPDAKAEARARIVSMLAGGGYGQREIGVRINGVGTEWHGDDIDAFAASAAHVIAIPKVESPATVQAVAARMEKAGAPATMQIWCMIETARGVLSVDAIASSHPRVGALMIGSADLTKDLRARHTPDRLPLLTSIQMVVLAGRANGLTILDSPFFDLSDDDGFLAACKQGRDLGFDGKTLLHPKTIAGANQAFGPSAEEIDWAHRITAAHEEALADGKGVTLVDGQLVEGLHVEEAQRLVALADTIAALEADSGAD